MAEEAEAVRTRCDAVATSHPGPTGGSTATQITIGDRTGTLLTTGIGPVNAAAALARWLGTAEPAPVISIGSAGGLAPSIAAGDVVIGRRYRYADVDARAFGYEYGQVPGMSVEYPATIMPTVEASHIHTGLLVTGSSFVDACVAEQIRGHLPEALAVDMESAALAQVCAITGAHQFMSIRGISDLCSPAAGEEFHDGLGRASARSAEVVLNVLTHLV